MGGRIDQTVSNLNTLLTHMHLRIVLLGDSSTARLLPAGSCSIRPAPVRVNCKQTGRCHKWCRSPMPNFHTSLVEPAEAMTLMCWLQGVEGPACSLVPLAGPATATSTGLKWNLSECPRTEGAVLQQGACAL